MSKIIELQKEYNKLFSKRFHKIAVLADVGDDIGYGKGLARLQVDIEKWVLKRDRIAFSRGYEEAKVDNQG